MTELEISLLGYPEIKIDHAPIKTDRRKAIALLAYLAVTGNSHTRDHLAGLFWPDYDHDSAYAYLRRTLWEMNQAIGKGWIEADRDQIKLVQDQNIYLDTSAFEELAKNNMGKIDTLEEAITLYHDDFMAGFSVSDTSPFETWQSEQAAYFRREFGTVLQMLVEVLTDQEQYKTALPYARKWLALDHLNEAAHRAIMRTLALMGDRTGAVRQYEACQQALDSEMSIPPQAETTALYQMILEGNIQTTVPAALAEAQANSKPLVRLPVISTPFIGRRFEIEKLKELIQNTEYRLITLLGLGGTGKTRLSIQSTSEIADRYPDGVYFVPLAQVQTEDAILNTIARTLNFSFYSEESNQKQQLFDFLSQKQMLLILDNFEHLIKASGLVTELLAHAPDIKLVATSRVRLNIQGEQLYHVSGMHMPSLDIISAWDNPGEQSKPFSAVQLFLDRARRVQPDFELTKENIEPVVQICQMVEGMPLGIELAASWLELLPPEEITKEIIRGLDFLETEQEDVPQRQRSIRAVFESSWNLLAEKDQKAFLRLCVFEGSFSRKAAQQVSGLSLQNLRGLVNKSWLQQTDEGRFQLHELMRQYGEERLKADEPAWVEAKQHHAEYFANFVERQSELMRSPDQLAGMKAMAEEIDGNIHIAWDWLISEKRWKTLIDKMGLGLFHYSFLRWKTVNLISWFRKARLAIESTSISKDRFAYCILSTLEINEEEFNEIKDANPIERLGSTLQMVDEYNLAIKMGIWYIQMAGLAQARNIILKDNKAIEIIFSQFKEENKRWELGFSLLLLSNWWSQYKMDGNMLLEAEKNFREAGTPFEQGLVNEQLGKYAYQQRRPYSEVIGYYEQARQHYKQLTGFTFKNITLTHLVDIYFQQGEHEKGFALFHEDQNELERTGQFRLLEDSKNWEALFTARYSTFEDAYRVRQESLKLAEKYGSQSDIAWRLFELGEIYRIFGQRDKALELYEQAYPMFEKMQMLNALGFDQRRRGDFALQDELYSDALKYYRKYLDYAKEDNLLWSIAHAQSRIALANAYLGNIKDARRDLKIVLAEIYSWRQNDLITQTLLAEPVCLLAEGKNEEAIELAALIANHHISWNESKQHAEEILEAASKGLSQSAFESAVEQGKKKSLDTVIKELIKNL